MNKQLGPTHQIEWLTCRCEPLGLSNQRVHLCSSGWVAGVAPADSALPSLAGFEVVASACDITSGATTVVRMQALRHPLLLAKY